MLLPWRNYSLSAMISIGSALVYHFTQGFARFEVRNPFFRDRHTLPAARVTPHTRWSAADGKTAKSTDLDTVSFDQCIIHRVQNGLDSVFCVAVRELRKTPSQFLNKVGAGHGLQCERVLVGKKQVQSNLPLARRTKMPMRQRQSDRQNRLLSCCCPAWHATKHPGWWCRRFHGMTVRSRRPWLHFDRQHPWL